MPDKAAVEILVYKPDSDHPRPENQRGVVVNPRLKKRFNQFISIGVYLDGADLKYYFFERCDKTPKIYTDWDKLKQDLPEGLENIFENKPKLFIMGHGNGGYYGLANCHGPSEQLYDENFDKLLVDFKQALPEHHQEEVFVTLEACNTDSQADAAANRQEKTFLERVSVKHPDITFGGTGPWDAEDAQTGFRSLAPEAPITSMGGNIWKPGNSVIFYHDGCQVAVKKSLFASTETAKSLKVNTVGYARVMLREGASEELIERIALRRDILKIQDLKKVDGFPGLQLEGEEVSAFVEQEKQILEEEQRNYLTRVRGILARADRPESLTDRNILELTLGLKEPSIFEGHDSLLQTILANKNLLQLLMVSCGKVLIGGPSNDNVIDLLLKHGADINSIDERGMTALHYAAQNFYNYRKEPLGLIKKLLVSAASLEVKDNQGRMAIDIARAHSEDKRVTDSEKLLASLQHGSSPPTPSELRQAVRKIFQMSAHMAGELSSLPAGRERGYLSCAEGTLYMPEDAVAKLDALLQPLRGNQELLSAFKLELGLVIIDLVGGRMTGEVLDDEIERVPKCFEGAAGELISVTNTLDAMKQEAGLSGAAEEQVAARRAPK